MPHTRIVDMSAEFEAGNRRIFSTPLLEALAARLERGEKTVLFINRRGTARFVLCRTCGHVPGCARCSVSFITHRAEGLLRCHYCAMRSARSPTPVRSAGCADPPGVIGRERSAVEALSERCATLLHDDEERWEVLGPAPYPVARINDEWRYRLALKTRDIDVVRAALRERIVPVAHAQRATRIAINVDP